MYQMIRTVPKDRLAPHFHLNRKGPAQNSRFFPNENNPWVEASKVNSYCKKLWSQMRCSAWQNSRMHCGEVLVLAGSAGSARLFWVGAGIVTLPWNWRLCWCLYEWFFKVFCSLQWYMGNVVCISHWLDTLETYMESLFRFEVKYLLDPKIKAGYEEH
jgi:hypothetical protein